jgi:hypothetical protein
MQVLLPLSQAHLSPVLDNVAAVAAQAGVAVTDTKLLLLLHLWLEQQRMLLGLLRTGLCC